MVISVEKIFATPFYLTPVPPNASAKGRGVK